MDPIITRPVDRPPATGSAPAAARLGSYILSWAAVLAGVIMIALSAYMFYRFAENDTGLWVLVSAFVLCFGAGALAYGPLFIIAKLIRSGRVKPRRSQGGWVLALALPWLFAGGVLMTFPNNMRYLGGAAFIISLIFIIWSWRHFSHCRTDRRRG